MNPLRSRAEAALVEVTGAASVVRQCPRCGSLEHGRPLLVGSDLHVSISYAGDLGAIAWGNQPLGIDLERIDTEVPSSLTVAEWTHLEALGKASGTGLASWPDVIPPDRPSRPLDLPRGYVGTLAGDALGWQLVRLD